MVGIERDWSSLPAVILIEIFSYLSRNNTVNASSTCRNWRQCLFTSGIWRKVRFTVRNDNLKYDSRGATFLANHCGRLVRKATLEVDTRQHRDVRDALEIMEILSYNQGLQSFVIKPASTCGLNSRENVNMLHRYLSAIRDLIRNTRRLESIGFGFMSDLLDGGVDTILPLLSQFHGKHLRHLHLASVKEYPDNIRSLLPRTITAFDNFLNLQVLSLDYDYINVEMFAALAQPNKLPLSKLMLHLHSEPSLYIPNASWRELKVHSPQLEVSLTLLHSSTAVDALGGVLASEMPLAHFSQYFCSHMRSVAMHRMALIYSNTLQSIHVVDFMENYHANTYWELPEDPFVMAAWRCTRLNSLTVIGYKMYHEDIIAIARLRGADLLKLEVPDCCIDLPGNELHNDYDDVIWSKPPEYYRAAMIDEVRIQLARPWQPIQDSDLHPAVTDWNEDADQYYLSAILEQQAIA